MAINFTKIDITINDIIVFTFTVPVMVIDVKSAVLRNA